MLAGIRGADLDKIIQEARSYTASTFAESTKASYRSHLNAYLRFCLYFDLEPVPATQSTILYYTTFLACTLKPSSINNYLSAIRLLHLDSGLKNPLLDNFALANLKKGIARKIGTPPKQMRPLSCEMFLQMHNHLCFLNPKDIDFWAVCMIGFFGFLCKATLLPASAENKTDDCLLYGDLELIGFLDFNLHVRQTKTIQCRERILTLPYTACKGSPLFPVSALRSLMFVSPRDKIV